MVNRNYIKVICFLFCVFFASCNGYLPAEDLQCKDGICWDKKQQPFTGESRAYRKDGSIASKSTYVNGKRIGEWYTYGYNNDIIQRGSYWTEDQIKSVHVFDEISCQYIEVNEWKEADNKYIDIYVIKPENSSDSLASYIKNKFKAINKDNVNVSVVLD